MRTSIVVPCFNEVARFDLEAFREALRRDPNLDLVLVDDGSTDGTAPLLDEVRAAAPGRAEVIRMGQNRGKAEAVRRGVLRGLASKAEYVGYWDADLATPFDEVDLLRTALQNNPRFLLAMGSRVRLLGRRIERVPLRHYGGRAFATAASILLGVPVYDTQCGAKIFRRCDEVALAFGTPFLSRWIFDVEILARLLTADAAIGDRIVEVPLRLWKDVRGSKLRGRHVVTAAVDLVSIGYRYPGRAVRGENAAYQMCPRVREPL